MLYDTMRIAQGFAPAGIVREVSPLVIETRNVLEKGDTVEYLSPDTIEPVTVQVVDMVGQDGTIMERANPGNIVELQTDPTLPSVQQNSIVRKYIPPL